MLKPLLLAAVLVAQASGPMPIAVPMPPRRAPMVSPAQGVNDGISVTGSGFANAQAAQAQVTLRVSTRGNALTLDARALQPIVDALVRAGADRSSVTLPPYLVGQAHTNNATISAQVHHPTQAMLAQGIETIANAFAVMPDILLNSAEVRLTADDCASLQRSAESNAIANARSNAAFVASQIGAKVGSVLAVNAPSAVTGSPNSCATMYAIGPYGSPFEQLSPADMLTVKIYSSVMMRFAIKR